MSTPAAPIPTPTPRPILVPVDNPLEDSFDDPVSDSTFVVADVADEGRLTASVELVSGTAEDDDRDEAA